MPGTSSRALPLPRLAACVAAFGVLLPCHAFAQTWGDEPDDPRASRLHLGLRAGYAWTGASKAEDPPGAPSLLFGTAFTGSGFAGAGVLQYVLNQPGTAFQTALRTELGLATASTMGFVETSTYRREITFSTIHVEVPLLADLSWRTGVFRLGVHAGLSLRMGVSASAEEVRGAGSPPDPPLAIRTGLSPNLLLGFQTAVDLGRVVLPVELRWRRNLTYPNTTLDRFDAYRGPENPGTYLVDTDWAVTVSLGVDIRLGGRSRPEPASTYVPPPEYVSAPVAPVAPPPPQLPDQDGDGVPDLYDACPIEPVLPGEIGPFPGCPASGGIVTVSCDYIDIAVPIEFESGSSNIAGESWPILYILADTLAVTPNIRLVRVEGHTDNRGSATANRRLSQQRADAVVEFLIDAGVDPWRLESVGYGPDYPVADNRTEEGRALNRRVDFLILENDTCQ